MTEGVVQLLGNPLEDIHTGSEEGTRASLAFTSA